MRFRTIDLVFAMTIAAFAAVLAGEIFYGRAPVQLEELLSLLFVLCAGLAIGVTCGYLWRADPARTEPRLRLFLMSLPVVLVWAGALRLQQGTLNVLRMSDNMLPSLLEWYMELDDFRFFEVVTGVMVTTMMWGVVTQRATMVRVVAAVGCGAWMLLFAGGYVAAAAMTVHFGGLP